MTTLLAVAAFALLFALTALVPLSGDEEGCGEGCHGCSGTDCEIDAGPFAAGR